jgi:hypothetical protein
VELRRHIFGMRGGNYDITLSVIAPYIELASDGKEPALGQFSEAIVGAIKKAGNAAHRAMERPERGLSIRDAAWRVMESAYAVASGDGGYPANARQIMYAARPSILELTGRDALDDKYFTQTLLPDYLEEHPSETAGWDVVFDARGHFVEPHTTRSVPLGRSTCASISAIARNRSGRHRLIRVRCCRQSARQTAIRLSSSSRRRASIRCWRRRALPSAST